MWIVAMTSALALLFFVGGGAILRDFASLWRHGQESWGTMFDVKSAYRGSIRFPGPDGRACVIRDTAPPRFATFTEGQQRRVTWVVVPRAPAWRRWPRVAEYEPELSLRWYWHDRAYQRGNVVTGVVMLAVGIAVGGMPVWVDDGPSRHVVHHAPCREALPGGGYIVVPCRDPMPPHS